MKLSNLIDSFETIQKGFRRYQGNRTNMSEDQKNLQERIFNKMRYALSLNLALIFNELMSNSFKYAFQNKSSGAIRIKANQTGNKSIEFNYADNGEWIEPAHEDSFGLELIEALTEQLGGTVKRSTTGGTHYSFIFESESL